MDVEAGQEDFVGSNDHTQVLKRKRTTKRRQRSSSPFGVVAMTTSSSSNGCDGGGGGGCERGGGGEGEGVEDCNYSISSPTISSGEIYESTEEEEDMANCLIMLARGDGPKQIEEKGKLIENFNTDDQKFKFSTTVNKAGGMGFYIYECKTCNRSFPSFQALGGHRASHKKPKYGAVEEKKEKGIPPPLKEEFEENRIRNSISLQVIVAATTTTNNNKAKIHECSICGSEFTSGQALGGHMRRHRAAAAATTNHHHQVSMSTIHTISTTIDTKIINGEMIEIKPRNILPLDLNLPAPEDHDHRDSKFQFGSTQQALVFSAPALIDCHY